MLFTLAFVIMIELEISATGERDLNRSRHIDHRLVMVPELSEKVDSNDEIARLEIDDMVLTWRETPGNFSNLDGSRAP
jgi:hypothetical protein